MTGSMRIVLASSGVNEFALLHEVCVSAGHTPVAYAYSRSMRPGQDTDAYIAGAGRALQPVDVLDGLV